MTPNGASVLSHHAGYVTSYQDDRTRNPPPRAFIATRDLLAASGQILVATDNPHRAARSEWRLGTRECDAMGKYDPLFEFLCRRPTVALDLNFEDLEVLVGPLPASARRYPAWWANEAEGGRHVQARAWLNAGREVERVDVSRGSVRFSVARWRRGS